MALDRDTLQEIKKYMDQRADGWRAYSTESSRSEFRAEMNLNEQRATRRLQFWVTVGGLSLAALGAFAYSSVVGTAERIALAQTQIAIENNKESKQEKDNRLANELEVLSGQIKKIIAARAQMEAALILAASAVEVARTVRKDTTKTSDELTDALTGAQDILATAKKQVAGINVSNLKIRTEVKKLEMALDEAAARRTELEKLSKNIALAKSISEDLVGAGGDIDKIVISALKNEDVKKQIVNAAAFPSGAVVPFVNVPLRQAACPVGWSYFRSAENRFVLGAGERNPPGQLGGEETVVLTISEMPSHSHKETLGEFTASFPSQQGLLVTGNAQAGFNAGRSQRTRSAGDDQPHNNMPPYIALYFCKKD